MNWKKFLSRKFLLAGTIMVLGVIDATVPGAGDLITWPVVAGPLAFIFGEAGYDIIRAYIEWTKPKG